MALYLPESLNLEDTIKKYPPHEIANFRIEKAIYILDLITRVPASNRKIKVKNGFIPLSTKSLQDKFTDCCIYLSYLKRINVLESDNHYIPDKKCRGYRFAEAYMGKVIPIKPLTKLRKNSILNQHKRGTAIANATYPYLMKWYNENLVIDYPSALKQLNDLHAKYNPKGDTEDKRERCFQSFFNSHYRSITDFHFQDFRAKIDNFGYRLHTNITNISKKYRPLITYKGLALSSIDIRSSQPYISTILLNEQFYRENKATQKPTSLSNIKHTEVFYSTEEITGKIEYNQYPPNILLKYPPLMLLSFKELATTGDIEKYKKLVSDGTIYDYFADKVLDQVGQDFVKYYLNLDLSIRNHKKELFYKAIFSDNTFIDQPDAAHVRQFQREFPSVHRIFYEIKKDDKDNLVRCLQRSESHFVLNVICRYFAEAYPDVPIYTIHDCMITIQSHSQYLAQIAEQVLTEAIGLKPRLKEEKWE